MTERPFVTMDVFTDRPFGGNPLAIFPDSDDLDSATMQMIAGEMNLSETVFLSRPDDGGDARLRIFTPAVELPFAGHPTVGAAALLFDRSGGGSSGDLSLQTRAGSIAATVNRLDQGILESLVTVPCLPTKGTALSCEDAAAVLGLEFEDIAREPTGYEAGVPFCFVPLRSRDALARAAVDAAQWNAKLRHAWAPHLYVFTMDERPGSDVIHARMFAPGLGIAEDPATGGAVAALAGFLCATRSLPDGTATWTVHQGVEMGRPSRIGLEADLSGDRLTAVRIRGSSIPMAQGVLRLPA